MKKGLFITFEGGEGSGKSTQSKALKRRLQNAGFEVVLVKEPGSTAVGKSARRMLKHKLEMKLEATTELLLFNVARSQLVAEVIRPALDGGKIVICDRYAESSVAYQGYGRGLDLDTVKTINRIATGGLQPDLIILPDIDVKEGINRKGAASAKDRFEREKLSFHQRVREGYLTMADSDPNRWLVVDATLTKRKIGMRIWERVQGLVG